MLLCLGSINFGSIETIEKQIEKLVTFNKENGRIYWRQNPGQQDHPHEGCKNINFFKWSFDLNYYFAHKYNYRVTECKWDKKRIYSLWLK